MHAAAVAVPSKTSSKTKKLSAGLVLSALPVVFLVLDSTLKLMHPEPVAKAFADLGYPLDLATSLGLLQLACVALYVVPRTSFLGAIALTGYLGGAVASHVRIDSPWLSHTLFPVYLGVLLWAGLYLREPRLRALLPSRARAPS